ncbi:hypothetical protein E2562_027514 [Oryza meyeriana var. granulata]|uniref:Uncharacterized protein n=1 Tax=Oryza meyeriana var. granulata TaxID=110450 RepID=A0A6G1E2E6_9ORYZ|nr:hypothetical protein E2562_027514 [Oryza meyeriana var. granulata]
MELAATTAMQAVALPALDAQVAVWEAMRVTVREAEAQAPTLPPRIGVPTAVAVDRVLCAVPEGGGRRKWSYVMEGGASLGWSAGGGGAGLHRPSAMGVTFKVVPLSR